MPIEVLIVRNFDAAKNERTAICQPMGVVSQPDSYHP